ncbi:MAG: ATP-grasp domain-containing protein [Cyanobacteria bacterium J06635_13]
MIGQKIYNHDIMHCTHDAVVGNYLYSGRVLGTSEPDDLIQLHPNLESQWAAISAHYSRIGLSHSQNPIWNVDFAELKKHSDYEPSVFIFNDVLDNLNDDGHWFCQDNKDWQDVVNFINSKNNFIRLAEELKVNVPQTICGANKTELLAGKQEIPFPCYLKPAVSVDGVGIYRCENQAELANSLAKLDANTPLQIQQEVIAEKFLNLQYQVKDEGAEPLAATEQILDGFAHQGNRYPTAYQPWDLVEPMARWMEKKGMKGIFAFDVATVKEQTTSYAIECNPRFNGASYPTGIAQKLEISNWCSDNFTTKHRSLDEIDLAELEYDPTTKTGAIIYNWGSVLVGKVGLLIAGSIAQQDELRTILKQKLA